MPRPPKGRLPSRRETRAICPGGARHDAGRDITCQLRHRMHRPGNADRTPLRQGPSPVALGTRPAYPGRTRPCSGDESGVARDPGGAFSAPATARGPSSSGPQRNVGPPHGNRVTAPALRGTYGSDGPAGTRCRGGDLWIEKVPPAWSRMELSHSPFSQGRGAFSADAQPYSGLFPGGSRLRTAVDVGGVGRRKAHGSDGS